MALRVGWILKEGDFDCGCARRRVQSATGQRPALSAALSAELSAPYVGFFSPFSCRNKKRAKTQSHLMVKKIKRFTKNMHFSSANPLKMKRTGGIMLL